MAWWQAFASSLISSLKELWWESWGWHFDNMMILTRGHDDLSIALQGNSVMMMIIFDYWKPKSGAFVVFKSHAFVCWKLQDSHCCHFALSRSTVWKAGKGHHQPTSTTALLPTLYSSKNFTPINASMAVQIPPPQFKIFVCCNYFIFAQCPLFWSWTGGKISLLN